MLAEDGSISFVPELLDLLESALERYESLCGTISDSLQRELIITYLLGALCAESRAIAACMESAPMLEAIEPRALLHQCVQADPASVQAHRETITAELERRGWRTAAAAR